MKILGLFLVLALSIQVQAKQKSTLKLSPLVDAPPATSITDKTPADVPPADSNAALAIANFYPVSGAKVFLITPTYGLMDGSQNLKVGKFSRSGSGLITKINYQARLTQALALEFQTDFGTQDISETFRPTGSAGTIRSDYRNSGLGDFHLTLKNQQQRGLGNLYLGADLGLSPNTREDGSGNLDGNRLSGGQSLSPFIAYEQPVSNTRVYGIRGAMTLKGNRSVQGRDSSRVRIKYNETGDNVLSLGGFTEWQARRRVTMGAQARLDLHSDSAIEGVGAPIQVSAYQTMTLGLYGETAIGKRTTLVPALNLTTLFAPGSGSAEYVNDLALSMGARISL